MCKVLKIKSIKQVSYNPDYKSAPAGGMITSAYMNWQVNILLEMLGGKTFDQAAADVDYKDVIWKGLTAAISDYKIAGKLDCMNAMISKFKQSKELNYTTVTDVTFSCLIELGKSQLFEKIIKDPNSPYSKKLKELFKNKKLREIQEALMKNLGCTYQDTYDIMRLIPAQILDTLIKG